jgi:hypothetical protein
VATSIHAYMCVYTHTHIYPYPPYFPNHNTTHPEKNNHDPPPPTMKKQTHTGTVVCWNVAMEAATGRAAGTVLYAKHDRCGAFTKAGTAVIREAMATATAAVGGWVWWGVVLLGVCVCVCVCDGRVVGSFCVARSPKFPSFLPPIDDAHPPKKKTPTAPLF